MVWPKEALVIAPVADLRASADNTSELVDQLHWGEVVRLLGTRESWRYVQADDHYFGWVRSSLLNAMERGPRPWGEARVVAVPLAPVFEGMDSETSVIGHVPAGTRLIQQRELPEPWEPVDISGASGSPEPLRGYLSRDDTAVIRELPQRPPTADDLLATAEAFVGVPYLWGGTTALGMDCSGFVQQVYRLNGVRLDRDADQQAMEGRPVDEALAGDLLFFGAERITHVAISTGGEGYLHAPQSGALIQRGTFATRAPGLGRRYLADPS